MSVIREGIDNSGNWSFDKFKNRRVLRPDAGSSRPIPDALYLINEDKGSVEAIPAVPPANEGEAVIENQASSSDRDNPMVYVNAIIEGDATLKDLEGLPPELVKEVVRILEENIKVMGRNAEQSGQ